MRIFLEIINGRYAGTTEVLETGDVCAIGNAVGADLFLPNDDLLEPLHFIVKNDAENIFLEKLSGDFFVNNQPFEKGTAAHGDFIFAGSTLFCMTAENEKNSDKTVLSNLIERLSKISNLYLLVDENLDRKILPILEEYKVSFKPLKKMEGFEALTANPLIAKLSGKAKPLEILVRSFWGKGFLVFFESRKSAPETLADFQFLLEKTQIKAGADLRFYDPRVLRVALSESEPQHAQIFFDAAETFFIESQLPGHLFEFGGENQKITANLISLLPEKIDD